MQWHLYAAVKAMSSAHASPNRFSMFHYITVRGHNIMRIIMIAVIIIMIILLRLQNITVYKRAYTITTFVVYKNVRVCVCVLYFTRVLYRNYYCVAAVRKRTTTTTRTSLFRRASVGIFLFLVSTRCCLLLSSSLRLRG